MYQGVAITHPSRCAAEHLNRLPIRAAAKRLSHIIEPTAIMACSVPACILVSELVRPRRLLVTIALWSVGLLAAAAALFLLGLNFLLRPRLEYSMNRYMTNHHVSLGYAHFELLAGRLILRDLTIFQNVHPNHGGTEKGHCAVRGSQSVAAVASDRSSQIN